MKKGPAKLKLDGKAFCPAPEQGSVTHLRNVLKNLPRGEVFTSKEMERMGVNSNSIERYYHLLPECTRRWRNKRVWGHPEAIKAFDKMVNQ